jgi:hypothetical protein
MRNLFKKEKDIGILIKWIIIIGLSIWVIFFGVLWLIQVLGI